MVVYLPSMKFKPKQDDELFGRWILRQYYVLSFIIIIVIIFSFGILFFLIIRSFFL